MTEESGFDAYMKRIYKKDQEILEELGSDFDEEGVSYWDKWGKKAQDKEEFKLDEVW